MKSMRKKYFRILTLLVFVLTMLFASVQAMAANGLSFISIDYSSNAVGKKVGSYYYRSIIRMVGSYEEGNEKYYTSYQRSSKKKSGYTTILEKENGISSDYITDGSNIYYIDSKNNKLMQYNIKTKKSTSLAKITSQKDIYATFLYLNKNDIFVYYNNPRYKYMNSYILRYTIKNGAATKKVILKDKAVWNPAAQGRYVLYSDDKVTKAKGKKLYALDLSTGKSKLVAGSANATMVYAAGGAGYGLLAEKEAYAVYDKSKKTWSIYKYDFLKEKSTKLKSIKTSKDISLMWMGDSIWVRDSKGDLEKKVKF